MYLVQHTETKQQFAMKKIMKYHMKLKKQVLQFHHQNAFSENPFVAGKWCEFQTEVLIELFNSWAYVSVVRATKTTLMATFHAHSNSKASGNLLTTMEIDDVACFSRLL